MISDFCIGIEEQAMIAVKLFLSKVKGKTFIKSYSIPAILGDHKMC